MSHFISSYTLLVVKSALFADFILYTAYLYVSLDTENQIL